VVCHSCHALRQDDVDHGSANDSDDEPWSGEEFTDSDLEDDEAEELDEESE
jgi:hypothetical protein